MKKENKLEKIVKEESKLFVKNARVEIKKKLEIALLSLLGLEKDYHRGYEIDHCNGRNSVLIDAFRQYAIEEAAKIAKSYKPTKDDIANFNKAFEREYSSQMTYAIMDLANKKAQEEAKKAIDSININSDEIIDSILTSK